MSMRDFLADDDGATMVEYGLLIALVAVIAMGAVFALGGGVNTTFENANDCLADHTTC